MRLVGGVVTAVVRCIAEGGRGWAEAFIVEKGEVLFDADVIFWVDVVFII